MIANITVLAMMNDGKVGEVGMIERTEIINGLEREIKRIRKEPKEKMLGICMTVDEAEDIVALLKEQPEQKHGHWKGFTQSRYFGMDDDGEPIFRDGLFYVCSECRRKSIIQHPYCPRCGAKMDKEVSTWAT